MRERGGRERGESNTSLQLLGMASVCACVCVHVCVCVCACACVYVSGCGCVCFIAMATIVLRFFQMLNLWLEEPRLHDDALYLPGLPRQYGSQRLATIFSASDVISNTYLYIVHTMYSTCTRTLYIVHANIQYMYMYIYIVVLSVSVLDGVCASVEGQRSTTGVD